MLQCNARHGRRVVILKPLGDPVTLIGVTCVLAPQLRKRVVTLEIFETGLLGAQTYHQQPRLGPSYVPAGTGTSSLGQDQMKCGALHVGLQSLDEQMCSRKHCSPLATQMPGYPPQSKAAHGRAAGQHCTKCVCSMTGRRKKKVAQSPQQACAAQGIAADLPPRRLSSGALWC